MNNRLSLLSVLLCLGAAALLPPALKAGNDPVAAPGATVTVGNARFSVLTDRLIRMEWSEDGKFEDRATLAIINRNLPVPKFSSRRQGEGVVIKTSSLTLTYGGGGEFTSQNLRVEFKLGGKTVRWDPSKEDTGNLMGTARTLDGCMGPEKINNNDPMEKGILSRDGWAVVDESTRHLLVPSGSDWPDWVEARPGGRRQDLYLFAYGHDYKAALSDYAKVAGRIPMPPKYVFGYWWSRYWAYTDEEFLALGKEFRDRKLPIDIMVIDMDWHETWQGAARRLRRDEFGQGIGWTGYTWNRDLFADPEGFLAQLHSMKLKTSLNLHPASGIVVREKVYPDFVRDYLSRTTDYDGPKGYVYGEGDKTAAGKPATAGYHAPVPFRMDQQAWADAYFNSVIHPLEEQGVDFWWLDWQQWKESKYVPGLSNTFWLNYTFFNDKVRRSATLDPADVQRPLIYHRWGGLGSHRYQIGFSGDTHIRWEVLGYLPYFTATASNVLYGYWGHDLGGHMQGRSQAPTDPELYTRWLQYGVFSPIFKTHSTSSAVLERRFWAFPDHYRYMKEALELRYALAPYIYDCAREAYRSGISICRPLYYEYPENENAYTWKEVYFFGDDILAATICQPLDPATGTAERSVWFPPGTDWYDMAHRQVRRGGTTQTLPYTIAQNAWFIRSGAMIPLSEEGIQNLQERSDAMRLYIAPGKGRSTYTHYEDDEVSQAYENQYASTLFTKNSTSTTLTLEIGARSGSYRGMGTERRLTIILGGLDSKPRSAVMDGQELPVQYDKDTLEAAIVLPTHPHDTQKTLTIVY